MVTDDIFLELHTLIERFDREQIYILTDSNAATYCVPVLMEELGDLGAPFIQKLRDHTFILPAGEEHKTLDSVCRIWDFLISQHATRQALLLNLGGGMITDIGGFAASCYQRGIPFVNIPTTLLAIVDASEGAKTGFDYHGLKNQIGLFREALETIVYPPFLKTLPREQFLSGFAEMLKHALIASPLEWDRILALDIDRLYRHPDERLKEEFSAILTRSLDIKRYFYEIDPEEKDMRKTLNFGHTIGHAIESRLIERGEPQPHGYCVLWGMIAELYISHAQLGFPSQHLAQLVQIAKEYYGGILFSCKDYDRLIALMRHDKKNNGGQINFTLLRNIGNPFINRTADDELIREALDYLFSI
ncbi:MAG: 3-dehydroquinate synthase [Paludibacteraceae bacterium]|nr:3-dehydroquinate synthase [Paludibacteraceae bacterium]